MVTHFANGYLIQQAYSVSVCCGVILKMFVLVDSKILCGPFKVIALYFNTGDCGSFPLKKNIYTITNRTNSTIEGSVIGFQCTHTYKGTQIDVFNANTSIQVQCLSDGQWHPDPTWDVCGIGGLRETSNGG